MKIMRIGRNQYYTAIHTPGKVNSKGLLIGILRNDTFELTCTWRVQQDSMHHIKEMLDDLEAPEEWRQPHRKCLAYYILKKERMERLIYPSAPSNLFDMIKRQEAFTYHTLKKLSELSSRQLDKLLTLGQSERGETSVECLSLIHGRISLYNMIFHKNPHHIDKFKKMIIKAAKIHQGYSFSQML